MESIDNMKKSKTFTHELIKGSQVILLRHAESEHNEETKIFKSKEHTKAEKLRSITSLDQRDAPITLVGKKQCKDTSKITNELEVKVVLISPMRRALETAYHVFKSHPKFDSIEFIVVPTLKEKMTSSYCIPMNVIYDTESYKLKFPHFDCSLLQEYNDPLHYYLEDIKDDFAKKILKEMKSDPEDPCGSNAAELVIDYMHQCFPKRAESNRSALERIGRAKKYIHSLLQSKLSDSSGTFSEDSKIVVVSHGIICKLWTGKWERQLEEYDEIPMANSYERLANCQLYADNINFPLSSHHIS